MTHDLAIDAPANGLAPPPGAGARYHCPRSPWKLLGRRAGFAILGDHAATGNSRRAAQRADNAARYARLRAAGLCTRACGNRSKAPRCRGCRAAETLKQRERRKAKKREASE